MAARRADPRVGHFESQVLGLFGRLEIHGQDALRQPLAAREEGPGRGAVRAEASRSSSGSTATIPVKYRDADHAPASSNGTRRSSRSASRTRSRSRCRPDDADFDTLDVRHASVRWMTPRDAGASRSARPTSTRAPARSSTPTSAFGSLVARRPHAPSREDIAPSAWPALDAARAAPLGLDGRLLHATRGRARGDGVRPRRAARGAATLEPDSPEAEAFVDGVAEGRDDARGRPHARPAPQLPRVDGLHARAARRSGVHARPTASPAR